ncbi:MAG TPA: apolipoprotein N-acyltransferase, partial [Pyrinomonadaceae bacterium]|nr:apolipoprotein N-acyltransferase [Pyrinomonadaceae bacterium]
MEEAVSFGGGEGVGRRGKGRVKSVAALARASVPTIAEAFRAVASALLLLLAFPDFDLWPLAWVALVPLLYAVASRPRAPQSFFAGWLAGAVFFYASCHWLTFPMIRYAEIPAWLAHVLMLAPALAGGLFVGLFALGLARACARWGAGALLLAPPVWAACEWLRLGCIGQLWNALGYSQAFRPALIQAARFGGVYAVGFLILCVNAALAYALLRRDARSLAVSFSVIACVALAVCGLTLTAAPSTEGETGAVVVALQPNVVPDFGRGAAEYDALAERHFGQSAAALRKIDESGSVGSVKSKEGEDCGCGFEAPHFPARVVVWPESPMNFAYGRSAEFRERVARFAREGHASLLFNSLEPTKDGGGFNAAVLVNEEGRIIAQYDKIRLMPFGEYVPLPRWMPGAGVVRGVVGDFTPGERYTLMPLSGVDDGKNLRAGVFICLESAYPYITRRFAREGADVLIEMTNDAYQGDTAVLRQHLSNAVFRAVETGRTLLRVTN